MRRNQKGFTLIELLAVIVILAIIALIATPIVLNIITKARKSAAQDSLYGVIEAAKSTYMSTLLDDSPLQLPITVTCEEKTEADKKVAVCNYKDSSSTEATPVKLSFSGTVPTAGTFKLDEDGKVKEASGLKVNGFDCSIDADGKVTCGA